MSQVEYIARVHDEDGSYWAEVLDLPGCFASGDSLDELREALAESISLYLADEASTDIASPAATRALSIDEIRVAVSA
jgi:predicted RNase H-like HicB family nuclease